MRAVIAVKGGWHCHTLAGSIEALRQVCAEKLSWRSLHKTRILSVVSRMHRQAAPVQAFFMAGFFIEFP